MSQTMVGTPWFWPANLIYLTEFSNLGGMLHNDDKSKYPVTKL